MKQIITLAILASAMIWNPAMAQKSNKFGHINSQELLPQFPEYKAAVAKMDSITKDIQKQLSGLRPGTEEYVNALKKLGAVKDEIGDLKDEINAFAGD